MNSGLYIILYINISFQFNCRHSATRSWIPHMGRRQGVCKTTVQLKISCIGKFRIWDLQETWRLPKPQRSTMLRSRATFVFICGVDTWPAMSALDRFQVVRFGPPWFRSLELRSRHRSLLFRWI